MKTQMTESMKIKLLVTGLLIVLMTACAVAQTNKVVKLDLTIKINNQEIPDTSYLLDIVNYNTGVLTSVKASSNFILSLDYNTEFEISVSYKGTNTKTIMINTEAPIDNWYIISSINLNTTNNKKILAGGIKYDTLLKTFKKYK
jgi:hypothetical protein